MKNNTNLTLDTKNKSKIYEAATKSIFIDLKYDTHKL